MGSWSVLKIDYWGRETALPCPALLNIGVISILAIFGKKSEIFTADERGLTPIFQGFIR